MLLVIGLFLAWLGVSLCVVLACVRSGQISQAGLEFEDIASSRQLAFSELLDATTQAAQQPVAWMGFPKSGPASALTPTGTSGDTVQ